MGQVTLYRLRPRGPMHFGGVGIVIPEEGAPPRPSGERRRSMEGAREFPSAATLFGAWCWALRDLAGERALTAMLNRFREGAPPFLLAAPLPWIGDVLLMPRVKFPPIPDPEGRLRVPDKRGKRYRWVEQGLWERLTRGERGSDVVRAAFKQDAAFLQGQAIWAGDATSAAAALREALDATPHAADGEGAFWRVATVPRVAVGRRTGQGNIFHLSATWLAPGVDLALPVVWRPAGKDLRPLMERALVFLGDEGIGGERSAGYGQFDLVMEPGADGAPRAREEEWADLAAGTTHFVTLSGYHPTMEEVGAGVFGEGASYELEGSTGWVGRSTYMHGVRMASAGSVLRRVPGQDVYGGLVNVQPEPMEAAGGHPVWRYGYAFPYPAVVDAA